MSEGPLRSRRAFLIGTSALLLSGLVKGLVPVRLWLSPTPLGRRLAGLLQHRQGAQLIGQEYLRRAPAEGSVRVLVGLIASSLPHGTRRLSALSDEELRAHVLRSVHKDFEDGRVVNLGGWIVSLTEARLCAVAALAEPLYLK